MSTAKEIKGLIDWLNKVPKEKKIIEETIEKIGNLLVGEIRRKFMEELKSQPDHKPNYYEVALETLKSILKEIEGTED